MKILKKAYYLICLIFLMLIILLGFRNLNNKNVTYKENVIKNKEIFKEITPIEVDVNGDTWIGVDMATINYASNDRIVIHGNFGLFVYDLNKNKVIRSVDVKSIKCGSTQGDNACAVSVSSDSNIVQLHPSSSENMYVYNVEKNTLIETKYNEMEDKLKTLSIDDSFEVNDGQFCYSYIKLESGEVSYLRCPPSNKAVDLQYVKNNEIYNIFK